MRHRLSYVFMFLILSSLFSCKRKYEEGPLINISSKCKRLQRGWTLEYLYIDGIDSTDAVYKSLGIVDNRFKIIMVSQREGNNCSSGEIVVRYRIDLADPYSRNFSGYYGFGSKEKYLIMNILYTDQTLNLKYRPVGPFFTNEKLEYRIKRLTKDELWLEINYNGKNVWCHFKG